MLVGESQSQEIATAKFNGAWDIPRFHESG